MTTFECGKCGGERAAEAGGVCPACGEPRRLVRKSLTARVPVTASMIRRAAITAYEMNRKLAGAAVGVATAGQSLGLLVQVRGVHYGPIADVAGEAVNRGGEQVAERMMRRAWKRVTRTTTYTD